MALLGTVLIGAGPGAATAADPILQLGLYRKEGDAWGAWSSLQRHQPEMARTLTPDVLPSDLQGGVVLRAAVAPGVEPYRLCRRIVGAGFGCLVIVEPQAEPTKSAALPESKPDAGPAPGPSGNHNRNPAPTTTTATPTSPATPLPSPTPAPQTDGTVSYDREDARVMKAIEQSNRRKGRLGSVVIDTEYDVMPAQLEREGWNLCALTFDDGPHRVVTRKILEVLNREGIRATYFPVGSVAATQGEVIRDFVASGHEIGNHSLTHSDMRAMPAAAQKTEIAESNRILRSFDAKPVLFRPPYGRYTLELLANARAEGMIPVLWSVDTRDWQVRDPDKIVQHVRTAAGTGSVLLMHSTYPSTLSALPRVIKELRAKGCQFVTLSEWIERMQRLAAPHMVNASEPVISASAPIDPAQN